MNTKENFGVWLRRRRRALDLTQKQLAELAGCSTITIRKFEAGERIPSQDLAVLLARSLAVPTEEQEWFVAFARGKATAEKLEPTFSGEAPPEITPNNLPAALTTLIGRDEDVAAVCQLIIDSRTRLLTLTGPGGTGKTSLSLEAGRRLANQTPSLFPDGITLVELAAVNDPVLVLPVIAARLGLKEKGKQAAQEALTTYLNSRNQLLILDNFEQVVAAAGQLVRLLEAAPRLKLLVTSRSILQVYGEREYPVDTLALPDLSQRLSPDELLACAAVSLFVERTQAVKPSFVLDSGNAEAVTALCRRLDGLPLAIELAAARCRFFTPEALLAQVSQQLDLLASQNRHLTDRQRTLKGAIEWSYNLLKEDEQQLFNRLAVFAGGFSPADAAAVVGESEDNQFLNQLFGLVSNSVLQQVETADADDPLRFRFLLTVREYALEQLVASGEAERMRDRHAAHFLALGEEANQYMMQAEQAHWLKILDRATDNLRAALTWLLAPDAKASRYRDGTRLVVALQRFWDTRGQLQELEIWLELALRRRAILPVEVLSRLLHTSILLATYRSDYDKAQRTVEEVQNLASQLEDSTILVRTLQFTGLIAGQIGRYEEADAYLTEALELLQQAGASRLVELSIVQNNLAIVAYRLGQYDRAMILLEESLRLKRARNDRRAVATSLATMGNLARNQGNYEKAAEHLQESLSIRVELNDRIGLAHSISNLATLALAQKKNYQATVLYAASSTMREAIQLSLTPIEQEEIDADLGLLKEHLGSETFAQAWEVGQNQTLTETITFATGGSTPEAAATPLKHSRRFVQERQIASGGMGQVYLGIDTVTGEQVAVKKLKPGLLADHPDLPSRLIREGEILRQLNHPNIVRIIDTYQEGEDYLIVMEYVPGGSLREWLKEEGRLPLKSVLSIGLELADALARAHHVGVVHRDLKPENVLLAADGTPRLSDFGIAYRLGEGTRLTVPGSMILGTPAYCSPEVLGGLTLDACSDVWSFGVLLYELASGRNPFERPDMAATLTAILVEPLPNLAEERPEAPPELVKLLTQMLVRKRENRLDSMRQVAAVLESIKKAKGV